MNAPRRIQLRRTKGWKMPPNTIKVDRSTPWGNPFVVGERCDRSEAVLHFNWLVMGPLTSYFGEACLERQRMWARHAREHLHELRGKNLACWCKEGDPCHADILLEITNR